MLVSFIVNFFGSLSAFASKIDFQSICQNQNKQFNIEKQAARLLTCNWWWLVGYKQQNPQTRAEQLYSLLSKFEVTLNFHFFISSTHIYASCSLNMCNLHPSFFRVQIPFELSYRWFSLSTGVRNSVIHSVLCPSLTPLALWFFYQSPLPLLPRGSMSSCERVKPSDLVLGRQMKCHVLKSGCFCFLLHSLSLH